MLDPQRVPVIVGVGEITDRPELIEQALEPLALMECALRAAESDAGAALLTQLESIELIGLISWRYQDPVSQLCTRLGITPARKINASMGGETPIRLIHEAAAGIARGELRAAAIVGAEAMHSAGRAKKQKLRLPWTAPAAKDKATQFASSSFELSPVAKRLGVWDPARIYPFYEMAAQAAWQQTPAQGQAESATLWAQYAREAAANEQAWLRKAPDAAQIAQISDDNRLINWPYPKLMTANPNVNQGAAVIVTSLALARAAGIAEGRIVHIHGGAEAREPEDWLKRDRYDRSAAQTAVLNRAVELAGGKADRFAKMELYSCFPVVPKMALRVLGLDSTQQIPTVTGGLTFFGGPRNNYMTHAVCAMVRALRAAPQELGLLYGQGGYVNKHHALVLGAQAPAAALALDYSVQTIAEAASDPVPALLDHYCGPAKIETYTIAYGRDGKPLHGLVVLRTPKSERCLAKVAADDVESMRLLESTERNAIGSAGQVRIDVFGEPIWEAGEQARDRRALPKKFCTVEREGPLTLISINRPESMNSLHPPCNAELAEIFDAFAADPDQWVAILTGAGDRAFSSGNDLKYTALAFARGDGLPIPTTGFAGLTARFDLNKPVIAAVNGLALGGGFEVALACDLIIASETASFALPEPKVGLAAVAGGLLRLPRLIGEKRAMSLILTGRRVSAQEGLELGFVNQVTTPDTLMSEARRWAAEIIANSPMSIRAAKEVVRLGQAEPSVAEAYPRQQSYPAVRALFKSADFLEGPQAFAQKRAPKWQGK